MLESNAPEYPSAEVLASSAGDGESPFRALVSEREVSVAHRADDSLTVRSRPPQRTHPQHHQSAGYAAAHAKTKRLSPNSSHVPT